MLGNHFAVHKTYSQLNRQYLISLNCFFMQNGFCRCVGQACSMGSLILAAGSPGMRSSLPNARIMVHQPSGGAQV